jgi:hypothetical protein
MARTIVVVVKTAWVSVLTGAAWVRLFVDVPPRHGVGVVAYAHYVLATYLEPQRLLYPLAGAAALAGWLVNRWAIAALAGVGETPDDAAALAPLLDGFGTLRAVRTVFVELTLWSALGALAVAAPARASKPSKEDAR